MMENAEIPNYSDVAEQGYPQPPCSDHKGKNILPHHINMIPEGMDLKDGVALAYVASLDVEVELFRYEGREGDGGYQVEKRSGTESRDHEMKSLGTIGRDSR